MAIIRKTVSGLKPDSNYLFAVKPKNTEISASDEIPDSIRIKTPSSSSVPSSITGLQIKCNFESVMFIFTPVNDQDFAEYEYEIYNSSVIAPANLVSSGRKRSTVFVVSVDNSTRTVNATTGVETLTPKKYYGRVRAINTSGTGGLWTDLATHGGDTPLITDQYIGSLTAGKITTGLMTAEQVILQNASGILQSYTPTAGMSVIRSSNFVSGPLGTGAGWIIRGDGTAEFDAASIRGTLSANSIFINAYNRWARNSADTASNLEFVVGDINNQLYWNPTGGTPVGGVATSLLKVGNNTNFIKVDNGNLTVTGAITTNATISSSSAGGIAIGTSSLYFGANQYANANTPFYVDTSSRFSLGDKLYFDGTNLTVAGTINATGGTFTGSINANSGTISGATISGGNININSGLFKVDTSGNVFANNIYATGLANETGLQVRADGGVDGLTGTAGSLWLLSAIGTRTTDSSQYGIRLGSSSAYLSITYPRNPNTTGGREHVNIETNSGKYLRLSTPTGQIGLLGNTQTQRSQNAVTVAGDIILENYGPDADADDGNAPSGSRTVFSKNIGNSSSSTYCRIGLIDGLQYYGDPSSLREKKENITDLNGIEAINIIKNLRPRKYTWKPEVDDSDLEAALKRLDIHYGFVAEEVQESQPQLATYKMTPEFQNSWPNVSEEMFNEFPLIFYKEGAMPSITISAVKNLIERVEYLESQLAAQ
jgi:hypothetical protein